MGCTKSYPVVLPQNDDEKESRRKKLQKARSKYQLEQKTFQLTGPQQQIVNIVNVPPMVSLHIQYSSYAHWKVFLIEINLSVLHDIKKVSKTYFFYSTFFLLLTIDNLQKFRIWIYFHSKLIWKLRYKIKVFQFIRDAKNLVICTIETMDCISFVLFLLCKTFYNNFIFHLHTYIIIVSIKLNSLGNWKTFSSPDLPLCYRKTTISKVYIGFKY